MNQLKEKPFALLGVNVFDHEPAALKEVMTREELNWRSFADQGEIVRQWNFPMTPTFYAIDHEGTIRRKWVGSPGWESMDTFLDGLIREAEDARRSK